MPPTKCPTTGTRAKDQSSPYAFSKAYGDVGRTPDQVLEWLIRFGEKDLPALSKKEWGQLRNELTAFIQIGSYELLGYNLHEAIVFITSQEKRDKTFHTLHPETIDLKFAQKLQSLTNVSIKNLIGYATVYLPEITISLILRKNINSPFGSYKLYKNGILVDYDVQNDDARGMHVEFIVHLAQVLKEVGLRLEICDSPTCRKYFVMHRYDQQFCTKRCRSRVAMKEWRQKQKNEKSKTAKKGGSKRGTKTRKR